MAPRASTSSAAAPARSDKQLRLELADGRTTALHVARWSLAHTRVRVVRLAEREQLVAWCARTGCQDALVGGFYTRPAGEPLGELRLRGRAVAHIPFTAPWHATRACLHSAAGALNIDRRDALAYEPRGDLLQAGPLLVRGGKVICIDGEDPEGFSAAAGQFDSDITAKRHPRAAIGLTQDAVIAVVADGRSEDDAGLTLGELARALADLGADAAMNLDGGGSASLVCDGYLRNRPRERVGVELPGGRAVTTVIAFDTA